MVDVTLVCADGGCTVYPIMDCLEASIHHFWLMFIYLGYGHVRLLGDLAGAGETVLDDLGDDSGWQVQVLGSLGHPAGKGVVSEIKEHELLP